MSWLFQLQETQPVAHAIGTLALVCFAGMALGSVRFRGVGLGTAGVLFAGILTGHFGDPVDAATLSFVKEFGLVLFVFAIGLQLGPGFFAALRQQGLLLNGLAALLVLLGVTAAPFVGWLAGFDPASSAGIFCGASVNLPALGAVTQTLSTLPGVEPERQALPALACAVTYPTGIMASLLVLVTLQRLFRIDPVREAREHEERSRVPARSLERWTINVNRPELTGQRLDALPALRQGGLTIARIRRGDVTLVATGDAMLEPGDRIAVVGAPAELARFADLVGARSAEELPINDGNITGRRVLVTAGAALGRTLQELALGRRLGVTVTRVTRGDLELTATPALQLKFGDVLQIAGDAGNLERASRLLGDSVKELNATHFLPLFIGIFLGVVLGTLPIVIPGVPLPLRLGLAGGPLIVALLLGRFGRLGRLACHMPVNANLAFRDFGIALFFAAVGLEAGANFFATVFSATGVKWLLVGAGVTFVPMLIVGVIGRSIGKLNFVDLSGLMAGSTTNPPALAFASGMTGSDAPSVAYATVYPLTMLLRILSAQVLTLILIS